MDKSVFLMCKDVPVLTYDVDSCRYIILNEQLLPYPLKDRFKEIPKIPEFIPRDELDKFLREHIRLCDRNHAVFYSWLENRLLPSNRANAKWISLALSIDPFPKVELLYKYLGLSVTDNYWLTTDTNLKWDDVNVREININEGIASVALHGTSFHTKDNIITPELTTQGAYAKAWLRRDGSLWLYKKGAKDSTESRIEVEVSKILDKCNVRHVPYEMSEEPDPAGVESSTCCRCKCITDDRHMILPALDYSSYCNSHDMNFDLECMRIDSDLYYKMMIVDYLIANRDRHLMNWGFFVSDRDNSIQCMHPLFDHNNSFDSDYMNNPDYNYQALNGISMRKAAHHAMSKVDFHFTENITREDFITERHYKCFMSRAKELGVKTVEADRIDWCKSHAPSALQGEDIETLLNYMQNSWLDYLRNDYSKPNPM